MAKAKEIPYTQEHLKELLDYDPDTGVLRWRDRGLSWFSREKDWKIWNIKYSGKVAGHRETRKSSKCGYSVIALRVEDKLYLAHRIIWKYMTGEDPMFPLDHKNQDATDNSWSNLRKSSYLRNNRNVSKSTNNTSGVTGVCWKSKENMWLARVGDECVGRFKREDLDLAAMAVMERRLELGYSPSHGMEFSPNYNIED